MARRAIAVVGMPGSGKGTFCDVAKGYGWNVISFGDISRETTKRELERAEGAFAVADMADRLRKERGPDWIAREAVKRAEGVNGNVCFDDPRTAEEIYYLRQEYPSIKLVGMLSEDEDRYSRLLDRARWDDKGTLDDIRKKDQKGGAWGIPKLLELADYRIGNDGTLEDLKAKSSELLGTL